MLYLVSHQKLSAFTAVKLMVITISLALLCVCGYIGVRWARDMFLMSLFGPSATAAWAMPAANATVGSDHRSIEVQIDNRSSASATPVIKELDASGVKPTEKLPFYGAVVPKGGRSTIIFHLPKKVKKEDVSYRVRFLPSGAEMFGSVSSS